jgi:hypothetical protein
MPEGSKRKKHHDKDKYYRREFLIDRQIKHSKAKQILAKQSKA